MKTKRRNFIKLSLGAAAVTLPTINLSAASATIVIIGGGFGGASCATAIKRAMPSTKVILIEKNKFFHTCPFSNLVLSGERDIKQIRFGYDTLKEKYGIEVIHLDAIDVDADSKVVVLSDKSKIKYDKLVMSPGIDFRFDALEGFTSADTEKIPHAYKAGEQTLLLRKQLEGMKDGGVFALVPPTNPYRCPPGPYERVSVIANYFKKNKPKSKILIFDPKEKFSKQALFQEGWDSLYGKMITWYSGSVGGALESIDVDAKTLITDFGEETADVINYIPPQKAGAIAHKAGLTDSSGWCPVNADFTSKQAKDIYVIGDASISGKMPKSGFSANNQGKYVALDIVSKLKGGATPVFKLNNVCYSFVGDEYAVSVSAVYETKDNSIISVTSGTSPLKAPKDTRILEAHHAVSWYNAITNEMFG